MQATAPPDRHRRKTIMNGKYNVTAVRLLALALSAFALLTLKIPRAAAQGTDCHWEGTAPWCNGECGSGESERTRASSSPGAPPVYYGPDFGHSCTFGSKALCCKTPGGGSCRWDGTAPFCDGKCESFEHQGQPPDGGSAGRECASGSKVYCCYFPPTGSGSSALLKASPKFTRYAAVWEKEAGPAWQARHGLTPAQYQQAFNTLTQQGYRLVEVSGYSVDGKDTYAAIWEKRQGPAWV